jgi:hypothetical protein
MMPRSIPQRRHLGIWVAGVVSVVLFLFSRRSAVVPAVIPTPSWNLRFSSGGSGSTRALVYGRNSGLHIIRVSSADPYRLASLPPALADHELWIVSLGRSTLQLRGDAGDPTAMSFGANGHVIKAYRDSRGTGVRVW